MFCFLWFSIYFRIICLLFFHFVDLFFLCFCFVFIIFLIGVIILCDFFTKARCNSLGRSEDTVVKFQRDFKRNKKIGNRPRWFRQAGRRVGGQDGRIANAKYITYMGFDQNSFIRERPFLANKMFTFAKLSRTPCLSFAGPMLANNTSYKNSFTTWQITPKNHGSLLDSLFF